LSILQPPLQNVIDMDQPSGDPKDRLAAALAQLGRGIRRRQTCKP